MPRAGQLEVPRRLLHNTGTKDGLTMRYRIPSTLGNSLLALLLREALEEDFRIHPLDTLTMHGILAYDLQNSSWDAILFFVRKVFATVMVRPLLIQGGRSSRSKRVHREQAFEALIPSRAYTPSCWVARGFIASRRLKLP